MPDKPALAPFIEAGDRPRRAPRWDAARPLRSSSRCPAPRLPDALRGALDAAAGAEQVEHRRPRSRRPRARQVAARSRCFQRRGHFRASPTPSSAPPTSTQVTAVLQAALDADAVVIPFGGGTSISGSLEASADESRPVISVDLTRPRPPAGDRRARRRLARVQAGVFGPAPGASSSTRAATPSATTPTRSRTRRSAAGSRRARPACSPIATATSPTSSAACAS